MKPTQKILLVFYKIFGEFSCWKNCTCQFNDSGVCSDMESKPNPVERECCRVRFLLETLRVE